MPYRVFGKLSPMARLGAPDSVSGRMCGTGCGVHVPGCVVGTGACTWVHMVGTWVYIWVQDLGVFCLNVRKPPSLGLGLRPICENV